MIERRTTQGAAGSCLYNTRTQYSKDVCSTFHLDTKEALVYIFSTCLSEGDWDREVLSIFIYLYILLHWVDAFLSFLMHLSFASFQRDAGCQGMH